MMIRGKAMRHALILCVAIIGTAPVSAMGQPPRDIRENALKDREQLQEFDEARRYGDPRDVREARRDLYEAEAEDRENWQAYRRTHLDLYARGNWRAPFHYRSYGIGARVHPSAFEDRYLIRDPYRYRLPPARRDLRWVRHYDDVLLVNMRTGRVHEVHRRFFW